jgi:hypothetical protein
MDFQIPEDLCAGYGYPQLTGEAKRKILGENLLRLHGMDVAQARANLSRPHPRVRWSRPAGCSG